MSKHDASNGNLSYHATITCNYILHTPNIHYIVHVHVYNMYVYMYMYMYIVREISTMDKMASHHSHTQRWVWRHISSCSTLPDSPQTPRTKCASCPTSSAPAQYIYTHKSHKQVAITIQQLMEVKLRRLTLASPSRPS